MVRVKGRDDLENIEGHLGTAFRAAGLAPLHTLFVTTATEKEAAAETLGQFYRAANKLCQNENEFNKRARPKSAAPSIMSHLREPAQLAAIRGYNLAKEKLLAVNSETGRSIVQMIEKEITAAPRTPARRQFQIPVA